MLTFLLLSVFGSPTGTNLIIEIAAVGVFVCAGRMGRGRKDESEGVKEGGGRRGRDEVQERDLGNWKIADDERREGGRKRKGESFSKPSRL